jgi:hypothetical protein
MLRWLPSFEAFIRNGGLGGYHRSGMILRTVVSTKVSKKAAIGHQAEGPQKKSGLRGRTPPAQTNAKHEGPLRDHFSCTSIASLNKPAPTILRTGTLSLLFYRRISSNKIIILQGNRVRLFESTNSHESTRLPDRTEAAKRPSFHPRQAPSQLFSNYIPPVFRYLSRFLSWNCPLPC